MTQKITSSLLLMGLSSDEAKKRQLQYGKNVLVPEKKRNVLFQIFHIMQEPMFLLLLVAGTIYFMLGEPRDGLIMIIFVVAIIGIDVYQDWKSSKALKSLRDLSIPQVTVVRDNREISISSVDLVPEDIISICEGMKIPADGEIFMCNDLCIDESILTGESAVVWKETAKARHTCEFWRTDYVYAGTMVVGGSAVVKVKQIGQSTEFGKIGKSLSSQKNSQTPLQKQIRRLVTICAYIALLSFVIVAAITYWNLNLFPFKQRIIESILSGITLAMATIPEELPVVFTIFLSMGAWRLAKKNSLIRKLSSVETLGAVSHLCVDKTGTITMNQMTIQEIWSLEDYQSIFLETIGLSCETEPYDPMEKAILQYCENQGIEKKELFRKTLVREYSFTNTLKMMGHVWKMNEDSVVVAAKGSPESILSICRNSNIEKETIQDKIHEMSSKGFRVLAVGFQSIKKNDNIPEDLEHCTLDCCGLIAFEDPPRKTVKEDIAKCVKAGIRVIMITGDNSVTASAIGKKVGLMNADKVINGKDLENMSDQELYEKSKDIGIFARVTPEHKMRIIQLFKKENGVVAMTGDGVNDVPALQFADIGIAMGKRGSEVAREASDLILLDDNFSTIVSTIQDGRRIYNNIRKALLYIFTIHVPIILASLASPLLGIEPSKLFLLPIHIVLLELIIDPTCSIIFERLPSEKDVMEKPPRSRNETLLSWKEVSKSILQGVVIFCAVYSVYLLTLKQTGNENISRTYGLVILIFSSLFLVLYHAAKKGNRKSQYVNFIKDRVIQISMSSILIGTLLLIYSPIHTVFKLAPLSLMQFISAIGIAFLSVFWIQLFQKKNL
jgi:Ca2+-transporting ATPase